MKKSFLIAALAALTFQTIRGDNVMIQTPNTTMIIKAENGQELKFSYYGDRVNNAEASQLAEAGVDLNTPA